MNTVSKPADLGLIGLAVMGRNLALNIADHGYQVAVYNRTTSVTDEFVGDNPPAVFGDTGGGLIPCPTLKDFVATLKTPRIIIILVKAGPAVDAVCESLIRAGLSPDDIVIDGGNSLWTDTIRREKDYRGRLIFFGSGVSGGEVGARFGPSLMPGGDKNAWARLKPIWESISAKVDPDTGKPMENASPGKPVSGGEPCTTYIGPNGAGHYVKMVHNGIEYADMQLICEAYQILRTSCGMTPVEIGDVFSTWNEGDLDSYLMEITADILKQGDPTTGKPIIDVILDRAGMKGTGTWTAINALNLAVPAATITEAVFARGMSALKDERLKASKILAGPEGIPGGGSNDQPSGDAGEQFIATVHDALYCAKICAYAQGFQLMSAAQVEYDWKLNYGEIARIWRGGCIIRARFLQKITEAYQRAPNLDNLLLDDYFRARIEAAQSGWRQVVAHAVLSGIPTPAFASALAYYDSYRTETLPANLLQAMRDFFGAHTYERVDEERGKVFHLDWSGGRSEAEMS